MRNPSSNVRREEAFHQNSFVLHHLAPFHLGFSSGSLSLNNLSSFYLSIYLPTSLPINLLPHDSLCWNGHVLHQEFGGTAISHGLVFIIIFLIYIHLFIYLFWLRQVLVAACRIFVAACGLLSCGMQTLSCGMHAGFSSPTRDGTQAPCIGSMESYPLDHQGSPTG